MRVLMLGTVNSPHVAGLAETLAPELEEVVVAGWASPDLAHVHAVPGIRTVLAPRRALSRLGALFMPVWQRRLYARIRPDVVHVHGATELAVAAARARARPLLVTAWGSDVMSEDPAKLRNAAHALSHADAFTADSPMLLQACASLGGEARRGHLVGWGVDLERFSPGDRTAARRRLGLPGERLLLSARAIGSVYSTSTIVEAFDVLADADPGLHLAIRHLGESADGLVRSRHPERVHLLGPVAREKLPDIYRAADVVISIPRSDSAPRSVWEAMACGTPCVLSDLPWLEGMVTPGEDALVTDVESAAVADAARRILEDPGLGNALAERGRRLAERDHDEREHRRRWLDLYRALASRSSASA